MHDAALLLRRPEPTAPVDPSTTSTTPHGAPLSAHENADMASFARLRAAFRPTPGYLNAATSGLPTQGTVTALGRALHTWQDGRASAAAYDEDVRRAREGYARMVHVPADHVAIGSQTSTIVGMVAASVPDGAEVLCVEDDFTSVIFPFYAQAHRGVTVRLVPLERLAESVTPATDLVAYSLVQSATGEIADSATIASAARSAGALTLADVTQAAGWLPFVASEYDITVCSAYKWLCQPRGTAYLTVRPDLWDWLRPTGAGWYAGEEVWESCYGPQMRLADDARRFDVSPAWLSWAGAVPAMDLFADVPTALIHEYDGALADSLRTRIGQEPCGRPVVVLPDPDGAVAARLDAGGLVTSSRAGRVRIAFHAWNDEVDVDRVATALR